MSLYQTLLGHPFVYNHVRPFVVGGVDNSASYGALGAGPDDVVLDVGCGTGDAMNYLPEVAAYRGYDTDPIAIEFARKQAAHKGLSRWQFEVGIVDRALVDKVAPSRVMLCGLLHHLSDEQALDLLRALGSSKSVQRIATSDVVYLPGKHLSNLFAWLDRGKFVRAVDGYRALIRRAGLRIVEEKIVRSHPTNGRAEYLVFALESAPETGS
ncbi:MAG: class I SAM-dependent methyltransferase [Polyangiales bacterium]